MSVGQIFITAALVWLVVVIAYGFYRAGYSIGKKYIFVQRQDVEKIVAEVRVSKIALRSADNLQREVYDDIFYILLPKIKEYIVLEERENFIMQDAVFRGILYVGTKELKHEGKYW